jgi:DNA modification methylase
MQIQQSPISELRPHAHNARTHSRKQLRQIAKSIQKFGFCNPVLVDDSGQIIAGHGRVEAAKLIGIDTVPTCRLSHLNDADKRAYILADNKLAEAAGWDRQLLALELQELIDVNVDIELTGFGMAEVDLILDEAKEADSSTAESSDDVVPEVSNGPAISQVGDLWVLGQHRLLCGDARDQHAYDQLLDGATAEFVFTDPPYNVSIDGHVCGLGKVHHREFAMASGEMNETQFTEFLREVFGRLVGNTIDGAIHQICMDWRHCWEMLNAGRSVYSEFKNLCVWNKTNAGMGTFYRSKHELVFVWKAGNAHHINNFELGQHGRHRTNVWDYHGITTIGQKRTEELSMHPTVKPFALVADALRDCSRRGGLVLDPFCGSGTILIAAEKTGRKARAIEIDPHYVDVAVRRWQTHTGKCARLAGTNEPFEAIAEQRLAARSPPNGGQYEFKQ